jgi:hypothetical protein
MFSVRLAKLGDRCDPSSAGKRILHFPPGPGETRTPPNPSSRECGASLIVAAGGARRYRCGGLGHHTERFEAGYHGYHGYHVLRPHVGIWQCQIRGSECKTW